MYSLSSIIRLSLSPARLYSDVSLVIGPAAERGGRATPEWASVALQETFTVSLLNMLSLNKGPVSLEGTSKHHNSKTTTFNLIFKR